MFLQIIIRRKALLELFSTNIILVDPVKRYSNQSTGSDPCSRKPGSGRTLSQDILKTLLPLCLHSMLNRSPASDLSYMKCNQDAKSTPSARGDWNR